MVKALVLTGYGVNCEREMSLAARMAGAEVTVLHIRYVIQGKVKLSDYELLLFPGGFSFGDELGAGKAFANKLEHHLDGEQRSFKEKLQNFVLNGGCVLGVCNGFQLLVKLGLLPDGQEQCVSLAPNASGRFENRWAHHGVLPSACIFTKGIQRMYLPCRHGEGRFVCKDEETLDRLIKGQQVVFQYTNQEGEPTDSYPDNPNGSVRSVAGICDRSGRVLGMMAHPEAFLFPHNHPQHVNKQMACKEETHGEGLQLFINAVTYLREREGQKVGS